MTLAAIARKAADIAADKAHYLPLAQGANRGCLLGVGWSKSGFAYKERWRMIAQTQTGSMFDSELTVRADFARRNFQMVAQRVSQCVGPGKGAHRRAAYTHNGPARRLPIEHCVEIDDTIQVGQRHAQRAAHFCRNRLGQPAIETLGSVQGWQERRAALRRQLGKDRA